METIKKSMDNRQLTSFNIKGKWTVKGYEKGDKISLVREQNEQPTI